MWSLAYDSSPEVGIFTPPRLVPGRRLLTQAKGSKTLPPNNPSHLGQLLIVGWAFWFLDVTTPSSHLFSSCAIRLCFLVASSTRCLTGCEMPYTHRHGLGGGGGARTALGGSALHAQLLCVLQAVPQCRNGGKWSVPCHGVAHICMLCSTCTSLYIYIYIYIYTHISNGKRERA